MKDDRLYVRLSKKDKDRLIELSAPYGGVSNWISEKLGSNTVNIPPPEVITITRDITPANTLIPCKSCSDKDTANAILRAKVLMLEKELGLLKRERKIEKQDEPKSPYRLGVGV